MYGVSIGDIAESPYKFSRKPAEGFVLFDESRSHAFTDDTILTAAICHAILQTNDLTNEVELGPNIRRCLQEFTIDFPFAGYSAMFYSQVDHFRFLPYGNFSNGAARRICPVAWAGKTVEEVFTLIDICTGATHDHPEEVKGARAIALAVYLARHCISKEGKSDRKSKNMIRKYIQQRFYMLDFSLADIESTYSPDSSREGGVPQAIVAFLESDSFETAIRNAIEIGRNSAALASMTGAIAEAYYGIPEKLKSKALSHLDQRLIDVFDAFEEKYQSKRRSGANPEL